MLSNFAQNFLLIRFISWLARHEVAENEQRHDYTPTEVEEIAARLKASGYVEVEGRPKKGRKPLMPALAVVVGKNLRTIQRYLSEDTLSVKSSS